MAYTVELSRRASRQLKSFPRHLQVRIAARIDGLSGNPRPGGVKALSAAEGLYRLRVGDYRIIYAIKEDALLVLIVSVGHRRDVYRRL